MAERLNRYWRVFATGLCFAVFGLGGLVIRLLVYPLLLVCNRDPQERKHAAQALIHHSFRWFVGLMNFVGVISYETRHLERLHRQGLLILANHPSLIDVVFLISFIPKADCIVKASLLRNLFTRGPIQAAGFICNGGGARLLEDCTRSLDAGSNLIIFPEGTRTPLQGVPKLQRGAAHVAVKGRFDITPVRIHTSLPMLSKGWPWWKVPARKPHIIFEVREDIDIAQFCADAGNDSLAARRVTDYLSDYLFRGPSRASA